jgi:membrane fusion protein, multidrug efflux system
MAITESSHEGKLQSSTALHAPDAVSDQPKKRGWVWIFILIAIAGGGYYYYKTRGATESKAAPAPGGGGGGRAGAALGPVSVAVAPALKENVPYYLSGLGSVTAFNTVTVKTRVDGQLMKVHFTEGQFVHEGDLLAELDPRPFEVALEQMEGQLAKDQAQLKDARLDLGRYDELQKEGVIAQQQVDTQTAMVGQLEGAIRADQAQIDNEKLQLVYCKITAPLTGRVGLRLVDQGNIVHAADLTGLVVITQVQPVATLFTLPEDSLPEVIQHMKNEELGVEAYSRDDTTKLASGKLLTINNQIDPTTGTVQLKAEFPNSDLSLWPNQFVNVRLMLTVRKDAIVVPLAAIQRGTQGTYVYTVKGGKANLQPVTVDLTQGNISLISNGIKEGDQVVVDGQERLQSGASVEVHGAGGPAAGSGGGSQRAGGGAGPKGGHKGAGADSVAPTAAGPEADSGKPGEHKHKKQGSQDQ